MKNTGSENAPLVESTGSSAARSLDLRDSIFICYAHEDQKWCDWFRKRLSSDQAVRVWTDHDIEEGAHWHEMIQEKIRSARIALFLVSPSFVNSHYIATTEFPQIISSARAGGLVVKWVEIERTPETAIPGDLLAIQGYAVRDENRQRSSLEGDRGDESP